MKMTIIDNETREQFSVQIDEIQADGNKGIIQVRSLSSQAKIKSLSSQAKIKSETFCKLATWRDLTRDQIIKQSKLLEPTFEITKQVSVISAILELYNAINKNLIETDNNDKIKMLFLLYDLYQRLSKTKTDQRVQPPKKYVALDQIQRADSGADLSSSHSAEIVYKTKKNKNNSTHSATIKSSNVEKERILKSKQSVIGKSYEAESAMAGYYRAYLGKHRASNIKPVFENQKRKGVLIDKFTRFISFQNYLFNELGLKNTDFNSEDEVKAAAFKKLINFNYQFLVDFNILDILVASYFFEENDLHFANWGFILDKNGKIIDIARIDFDRSMWSITSKYLHLSPVGTDKHHTKPPIEIFPITEDEIRKFPDLHKSSPANWIFVWWLQTTMNSFSDPLNKKLVEDLKSHPNFERCKWQAFLKMILMPENIIENIPRNYIGKEKSAKKYAQHVMHRMKQLRKTLIGMPEFQEFMLSQGEKVFEEIKDQCFRHNAELKFKDVDISYDINKLYEDFANIRNDITNQFKTAFNQLSILICDQSLNDKNKEIKEDIFNYIKSLPIDGMDFNTYIKLGNLMDKTVKAVTDEEIENIKYDFSCLKLKATLANKHYPQSLRDQGQTVLNQVDKISDIDTSKKTAVIEAVDNLIQNPKVRQNQLDCLKKAKSLAPYPTSKRVVGGLIALAGLAIGLTAIGIAAVSLGTLTPVSILGLHFAASMMAVGTAYAVGGAGVAAAIGGGVLGGHVALFQPAKVVKATQQLNKIANNNGEQPKKLFSIK